MEGFFLHSFLLSFLLRPGQLASARGAGHTPYSLFSCVYPWPRTPPAQVDTQVSSSSTCSELLCSTHTTTKKSTFLAASSYVVDGGAAARMSGWDGKGRGGTNAKISSSDRGHDPKKWKIRLAEVFKFPQKGRKI